MPLYSETLYIRKEILFGVRAHENLPRLIWCAGDR